MGALKGYPGLSAFQIPFSDYAPLYLYFLKGLTFVPLPHLYTIKSLSFAFDILIALGVWALLGATTPLYPPRRFVLCALVLCIPTLVINSCVWAQSDAAYTAPIVFALLFMLTGNPLAAAVAFGVAISFKVQAIFYLPVIIGFLLRQPRTWPYALVIPLVYVASIVPAWLGGGNFTRLLTIYLRQAGEYSWLNAFSPSIFAYATGHTFSPGAEHGLAWAGIAVSYLVALAIVLIVARMDLRQRPVSLVYLSLLCLILVPYFLPRMHERYFYAADVFSVVYAFYRPKQWWVPVGVVTASYLSYMPFLSGQAAWFSRFQGIDVRIPATILSVVIVGLVLQLPPVVRQLTSYPAETPPRIGRPR